jgi:ribonuclease HI
VIYKTLALQIRLLAAIKDKPLRDILISLLSNTTLAWFDGADQLDGTSCEAGGLLKTPDLSVIRWVFNCGRGTITRAELMGVCATLMLASHMSLHHLQILGDSKVVIDWLSNRGRL